MDYCLLCAISACIVLVVIFINNVAKMNKTGTYPPGPPGFPLIGNIWRLPAMNPWHKLTEWKHEFGDVVYLHGLGQSVVVLNSMDSIIDLIDKRGKIYTHRPEFFVGGELFGIINTMVLKPPGKDMALQRRLAHSALNLDAVRQYHSRQESLSALMLLELLETPQNFMEHVRMTSGRLVMAITYGLSAAEVDAEYIDHAEATMKLVTTALVPGSYLVDAFPFIRHFVPRWLPFPSFWRDGQKGKLMVQELITKPFQHVKKQMAQGKPQHSFTQDILSNFKLPEGHTQEEFEDIVKWTAGTMYAAGGESTYATIIVFLMLMATHPEKQKLGRDEIFSVVGEDRLPTIADRSDLPYVMAIIKETMRWQVVLPLSIPRRAAQDDSYKGYFIPANATIIPNVWALSRETNGTANPRAFIPERFLDGQVTDPYSYAFGFGRRLCPGKAFAEGSLFILIASVLATFEITPALDETGQEIPINPSFASGLVSYPESFKCSIKPLNKQKEAMIRNCAAGCESDY